jgi:hypothetical protein
MHKGSRAIVVCILFIVVSGIWACLWVPPLPLYHRWGQNRRD